MKKTFTDSMASEMMTRLASAENVSLFRKDYIVAEDENLVQDKDSDKEDCSMADDEDDNDVSLALDTALASLLTASEALDIVGFEKSASLSLRLANFVAEAKKKNDSKKDSKKSDKKDSKKDSKKSDKKDSKKSDKKDSKDSKDSSKKSTTSTKKK